MSTVNQKKLDDRLSPILIKELRQGMRARVFILSFLLIQLCLIVLVLANLAAQDDSDAIEVQNRIFWFILGFALLLLMPLRGLGAISQEMRRNTMETILLTRLTAWRVVFGKWSAIFSQSILLATAVLPYLVLRYFIGGDDVVADFEGLLMMLWFSGVLIAACIGASALNNIVIRVILGLVGLWLLIAGTGINNFAMGRGDFWEIVVWLAIFGFFIPALLFELAASSFAPVSENHAVRRRILVLLFMAAVASVISLMRDNAQAQVGISLIVLIAVCYVELSEKARLLPRFVRPMSRRNWLGKLLWLFFLPGWPSGVLFSLVVIPSAFLIQLLMITPFFDASSSVFLKSLLLIFAIFGSALVPILICHLFWRKMNQVFLMIALYNLLIVCVASILKGFASLTNTPVDQVLVVVPSLPVFFINLQDSHDDLLLNYILGNVVVLAVLLSIVYISSRRYFRELFALARAGKNLEPSSIKAEAEALKPVA